jgi:hypothetical protein
MKEAELDQIIAGGERIVPSSGFAESVMNAVRREAATPKPIPFPWLRATPGLVAAAIAITRFVIAFFQQGGNRAPAAVGNGSSCGLVSVMHAATSPVTIWVGFVLLIALASLELSTHFLGDRV